jgi:hypothetical protein
MCQRRQLEDSDSAFSTRQRAVCVGGVEAYSMLTDLLYYDVVFCSPLSIISHSADAHQKLIDSGLVVDCSELLGPAELRARRGSFLTDLVAHPEKVNPDALDEILNQDLRRFAIEASNRTHLKVTPKYTSDVFQNTYKSGSEQVLGIICSCLPAISPSEPDVDALIAFLRDEGTASRKRRLFSWQNDIETQIEEGRLKVEHIPDLIATLLDDYAAWLRKSRLKLKYERRELVFYFLSSVLTAIRIPDAVREIFEFKKRRVTLLDDEKTPGRELAYIVYAREELPRKE